MYDRLQHVVWRRNLLWFVKHYIVKPVNPSLQLGNPTKTWPPMLQDPHPTSPSTSISFVVLKYQSNSSNISFCFPLLDWVTKRWLYVPPALKLNNSSLHSHNYFDLILKRSGDFSLNTTTNIVGQFSMSYSGIYSLSFGSETCDSNRGFC
jgi:hypothetical protein